MFKKIKYAKPLDETSVTPINNHISLGDTSSTVLSKNISTNEDAIFIVDRIPHPSYEVYGTNLYGTAARYYQTGGIPIPQEDELALNIRRKAICDIASNRLIFLLRNALATVNAMKIPFKGNVFSTTRDYDYNDNYVETQRCHYLYELFSASSEIVKLYPDYFDMSKLMMFSDANIFDISFVITTHIYTEYARVSNEVNGRRHSNKAADVLPQDIEDLNESYNQFYLALHKCILTAYMTAIEEFYQYYYYGGLPAIPNK